MKLFSALEKKKETWFLIFFGFIFFLLRLPSIFEPYWYGDEGIYEVIGYGLAHGRILYETIWDNKPPVLYWIYALFSGDQQAVKFLSLIFGLGALFIFFAFVRKLFKIKTNKIYYVSLILFTILFATPLLEGNIANAENFMLLPIITAGYIIFSYKENYANKYRPLIFAGVLLGISFLIKVVAIFDFGAFFLFLFITKFQSIKKVKSLFYELFTFLISFFTPIILVFLYFILRGTFSTFLKAAFFSNISYVNYGNQLIIPQGFLILKLILLLGFCGFIFLKRKLFSPRDIFIFLWFAFSLFNAFFSQRPYTHYLLVTITPLILFIDLIIETKLKKTYLTIPFIIALLIINFSFNPLKNILKPLFGYYANFLSFEVGVKNTDNYIKYFDPNALRDFQIAQYINSSKTAHKTLFLWSNSAQIYKMTNTLPSSRFTVLYHMTLSSSNMKEAENSFLKQKPQFVVITENSPSFFFSIPNYSEKLVVGSSYIYEKNN